VTGAVLPVTAITRNLVWAGDGSVWSCFEVEPFAYPHRSVGDAADVCARTEAALLALPSRSLILSMCRRLGTGELTRRVASVDPPPGWMAHATRTAARVAAYERVWVLAALLDDGSHHRRWGDRLRAAASAVATGFGTPHTAPGRFRVGAAMAQAEALVEQLTPHLDLAPMPADRVRWLYEAAATRGLAHPPIPDVGGGDRVAVRRLDRDTVYVEGGRRGDPGRPQHRRYFTVEHPDLGVCHQTMLCLGEIPAAWTFPYGSGEWLWHLDDQLPFPVDWGVVVERVDNQIARRRVMKARRNLTGQMEEPGSDPAGPATTVGAAAEAVDRVRGRLEANPQLPAYRATTIVAVADPDLDALERRAELVESTFETAGCNFYRPTGGQLAAFTAMLPGGPRHPVVAEYAQDLLGDGLASAMPFAATGVGDPTGMLLGTCLDTATPKPVFLDPRRGPRDLNRSGSLAVVGELGSGKSFLAKTLTVATVAMGGQVVAVDRTERGEYAALAGVLPGTAQVVRIDSAASVCLDPFQVFDTDELRLRYGVGFITLLTATAPASPAGTLCHRAAHQALQRAADAGRHPRLGDVIGELRATGAAASGLADQLEALSEVAEARLVFTPSSSDAVDLGVDYLCFHAPGLRLPRRGTVRDDLLPEELIGQAVLYLIAACSRRVLFRHPDRFAALLVDEAHAVTTNPQGRALVGELIRDGRKHYAAVWAFTQLPGDLTTATADGELDAGLDALLGYRAAFRQSAATARDALGFLGTDGRGGNVETVTGLGTGECLVRDLTGRLGVVSITPPEDPAVAAAFTTTPGHTTPAVLDPWPSLHTPPGSNGHRGRATTGGVAP
jgi:hypothetical protein